MKKAKFWKILAVLSLAVLPFSLVAVGQAQQMTCWDIKAGRIERKSLAYHHTQSFDQSGVNAEEHLKSANHSSESEGTKSISTCALG
jgi:hypothetical protein